MTLEPDIVPAAEQDRLRHRKQLLSMLLEITEAVEKGQVVGLFILSETNVGVLDVQGMWRNKLALVGALSVAHHNALVDFDESAEEDAGGVS